MENSAEDTKKVVVISGPTGSGKNAVLEGLLTRYKNCSRLVTATSRVIRAGEKEGVDYYFLSTDEFMQALTRGDILEHRYIESLGTHYGIYKPDLSKRLQEGGTILTQVDIVGARFLKEHYAATTIFIMPESLKILENRIRTRSSDISDAEVEHRINIARKEISEYAPQYDYRIVNKEGLLEEAIEEVVSILKKEGYNV